MKCIMFMLNPKPDETYIAYLPLAHVLELLSENTMMLFGIKVGKIHKRVQINNNRVINPSICEYFIPRFLFFE